MREIKFRVWNSVGKRMLYDSGLEVKGTKIISKYAMQFIGHKDKNGKEIYEGDILNATSLTRDETDKYKRCKIIIKDITKVSTILMSDYWEAEVIGNKFENPELLR